MNKRMYVGPTIDGVATRNTTYEELPERLSAAIEKRPYLSGLCVPISQLSKALQQIASHSGGVFTLYAKAEKEKTAIQKD